MHCVLENLSGNGMHANRDKCVLNSEEVSFLGYRISKDGIRPDQKLVSKIMAVRPPSSKKELDSFIGMVKFYGRYIDRFAERVEPLNELRRKGRVFIREKHHQVAFEDLKEALSVYPSSLQSTLLACQRHQAYLVGGGGGGGGTAVQEVSLSLLLLLLLLLPPAPLLRSPRGGNCLGCERLWQHRTLV